MRLVLRASKIRLLEHADAGYISLNDNGIAVLKVPDKRPRYITAQVDELEFFRLVHLAEDNTFRPTELGHEKIREFLQGGEHEDRNGSGTATDNTGGANPS